MQNKHVGLIGLGLFSLVGAFIGWLMWGPLLHWIWNQFPKDASWYGFIKVGGVLLVGCFGGVAIPLIFLILGLKFWSEY